MGRKMRVIALGLVVAGCASLHSTGLPAFCPFDGMPVDDVTSPLDPLPQAHAPPGYVVYHGQCESGWYSHDFFVTNRISK